MWLRTDDTTIRSKVSWYVPRWYFVPRLRREYSRLFNATSLVRIIVVSTITCAVFLAGCKPALPQIVRANLLQLSYAFLAPLLYMALVFAVHVAVPPVVIVRSRRIQISHGQSSTLIDSQDVTTACTTVHCNGKARLRIEFERNGKPGFRNVGVGPRVNPNDLASLLPVPLTIRDRAVETFDILSRAEWRSQRRRSVA